MVGIWARAVLLGFAINDGGAEGAAPAGNEGLRAALAARGVTLGLTLQGDPSVNLAGGRRRGSAVRWPLQAALDVDTELLFGWRGGHVHARVQALRGGHGTDLLVGDAQGFNNVDAEAFHQVSEFWLEQRLFGDRVRLKAGKADANADFAHVESAAGFLNSSAGYSPTILGFPTYPDPAMSVSAVADVAPWLSLGAGVYDGATNEGCHGRTGTRGLGTFFGAPDAVFVVGEAGLRFDLGGRRARVGVGGWTHTGTFQGFDGAARRGTSGWYALLEQRLRGARGDDAPGLDLFAQVGSSDPGVSEIERHVAVGLTATGALPGRERDVLGLMVSTIGMSARCPTARGRESAVEAYYGLKLRPWLEIKPDVQYILNPGAAGAANAVVGTVRVTLSF